MADLTDKQRRFVDEYLVDLNATQAAIRAGYSKNNADKIASQLLGKTRVSAAITEAMKKREERTQITADNVLRQLWKTGFADIRDFITVEQQYDEFGQSQQVVRIKPLEEIDGTLVSEISQTRDGIRFKRNDPMKALELVGRHLGMFNDKVNVDISGEVKSTNEQQYTITHTIDEYTASFANVLARRNSALGSDTQSDRLGQSIHSAETDDETS